jgi:hypothetical protein
MAILPRCPRCGQPLATFDGESYCPDCTTYATTPDPSGPAPTTPQVLVLGALRNRGWPAKLVEHLLTRCGAGRDDYDSLVSAEYVEAGEGRVVLTPAGRRALAAEKATHRHWA